MKAKDAMVAWTPTATNGQYETAGRIRVGPHPDVSGWSKDFLFTDLGCWGVVKNMEEKDLEQLCLQIALVAILRDKINPHDVDTAMREIDEYNNAFACHPAFKLFGLA